MNWPIAFSPATRSLFPGRRFFQLDVFPRIGVAGRDIGREHVLPFLRRDARADRIHKSVTEDRDEVVVLQDLALDLGGQAFPFGVVGRGEIFAELAVELRHAVAIPAVEAVAFNIGIVPVRPGSTDAASIHNDLDPRPLLQTALHLLEEYT